MRGKTCHGPMHRDASWWTYGKKRRAPLTEELRSWAPAAASLLRLILFCALETSGSATQHVFSLATPALPTAYQNSSQHFAKYLSSALYSHVLLASLNSRYIWMRVNQAKNNHHQTTHHPPESAARLHPLAYHVKQVDHLQSAAPPQASRCRKETPGQQWPVGGQNQ